MRKLGWLASFSVIVSVAWICYMSMYCLYNWETATITQLLFEGQEKDQRNPRQVTVTRGHRLSRSRRVFVPRWVPCRLNWRVWPADLACEWTRTPEDGHGHGSELLQASPQTCKLKSLQRLWTHLIFVYLMDPGCPPVSVRVNHSSPLVGTLKWRRRCILALWSLSDLIFCQKPLLSPLEIQSGGGGMLMRYFLKLTLVSLCANGVLKESSVCRNSFPGQNPTHSKIFF